GRRASPAAVVVQEATTAAAAVLPPAAATAAAATTTTTMTTAEPPTIGGVLQHAMPARGAAAFEQIASATAIGLHPMTARFPLQLRRVMCRVAYVPWAVMRDAARPRPLPELPPASFRTFVDAPSSPS